MCSSLAASHLPRWHRVRDGGPLMQQELGKQYSPCLCQDLSWGSLWQLSLLLSDSSKQLRYQTGIDFPCLDCFDRMIGAMSRLEGKDTYSFSLLILFFHSLHLDVIFILIHNGRKPLGIQWDKSGLQSGLHYILTVLLWASETTLRSWSFLLCMMETLPLVRLYRLNKGFIYSHECNTKPL